MKKVTLYTLTRSVLHHKSLEKYTTGLHQSTTLCHFKRNHFLLKIQFSVIFLLNESKPVSEMCVTASLGRLLRTHRRVSCRWATWQHHQSIF